SAAGEGTVGPGRASVVGDGQERLVVGLAGGGRGSDERLVSPELPRRRSAGVAAVDDDVAELVVGGLVVGHGDCLRDLRVGRPAVVGAEDVDLAGGDVVEGEQGGRRAISGDPFAVVTGQAGLDRQVGEGRAVVGRMGHGYRTQVQAGDVEGVVAARAGRACPGGVDVAP